MINKFVAGFTAGLAATWAFMGGKIAVEMWRERRAQRLLTTEQGEMATENEMKWAARYLEAAHQREAERTRQQAWAGMRGHEHHER